MKSYDCFEKVIDKNLFYEAYLNSQKGKRSSKQRAIEFASNWTVNLENLRQEIINKKYVPMPYEYFKVYEPKEREIQAPHYRDKIVQYAITQILRDIYEPCFIKNSYSCIRNKGNHLCCLDLIKMLRQAKKVFNGGYILKMDVKKFFPSINHEIMKKILRKKIKDKNMVWLLDTILDTNEKGLNIGNSTSQIMSNIYLNELDQFVKRNLKTEFYIRYADDLILFSYDKEIAKDYRNKIQKFLNENLKLTAHKIIINPISQGISTLGFHFKPTFNRLLSRNVRRIKKYDKKNENERIVSLNASFASIKYSMNMYLIGNMKNFEWNEKKKKYMFAWKEIENGIRIVFGTNLYE